MDIRYFLNILWRRLWLILLVAIIAVIATYYWVGQLPNTYKSNAVLSTRIIEDREFRIEDANPYMQEFVTTTKFNNLIRDLTSRSAVKQLTLNLLEHDLKESEDRPFRLLTSVEEGDEVRVNPEDLTDLSEDLELLRYKGDVPNEVYMEKMKLLKSVAESFGYSHAQLLENLTVSRIAETDYLNVEFTSENPELSYYTVSSFCDESINLIQSNQLLVENDYLEFQKDELAQTKHAYDSLTQVLNRYRSSQSVIDIDEQSKNIVGQIRELEMRREQSNSEIEGIKRSIKNLEYEIKRTARSNSDSHFGGVVLHEKVLKLGERIDKLQDRLVDEKDDDGSIKKQIIKLRKEKDVLTKRIGNRNGEDIDENLRENRRLREKKLNLELQLNETQEAVTSIDKEIKRKQRRQGTMVGQDAEIGLLEQQLEVAKIQFENANATYRKAMATAKKPGSTKLALVEPATFPEKPESKNRAIMSAFAGVASGVLTTLLIFIFSFFDNSLSSPYRFSQSYNLPLVGQINRLPKKHQDLNQIFNGSIQSKLIDKFRESLRKIRYAIETSGASTILVTSNKQGEGKSFFLLSLAYSLSLGNRRVLIIDTNFRSNSLSQYATQPSDQIPFEKGNSPVVFNGNKLTSLPIHKGHLPNNVHILGNFGGNMSPNEALGGKDFVKILYEYQQHYNYILLEGAALNDFADARELALYSDAVVGVFAAQSSKKSADDESVGFLKSLGNKYLGSILNRVDKRH